MCINKLFHFLLISTLQLQVTSYVQTVPHLKTFHNINRQTHHPHTRSSSSSLQMSTMIQKESIIQSSLKKPTKSLAVCLEYQPMNGEGTNAKKSDLEILSMQLRKSKATALWTSDINHVSILVEEQSTAAGNFPGPCPVIYNGDESKVDKAIAAGATAVVLTSSSSTATEIIDRIEVIWQVGSEDDISKIVADLGGNGLAFLVRGDDTSTTADELSNLISAIPKGNVVIASIDSMQEENAEIDIGRELKGVGCTSILLRQACVGDGEDLEYANFVVDGLTRKKSLEFGGISGLTGSTNGHFGGVASTGKTTWRRKRND